MKAWRQATCAALIATAFLPASLPAFAAEPAPAEPAHVITTVRGDNLIGLAKRWLVNPAQWPELARFNGLRNPNVVATGTALRLPLRLMRTEPVPATVLSVVGSASGGGSAVQVGQSLPEGSELNTGSDGHVTVRLVDGTVLRLRPDSRLQVRESRRLQGAADVVRSGAQLQQGRVEIEAAPAAAGRPGFSIGTPQGVLGVRGTEFRVTADAGASVTRGEVLGGVVAIAGNVGGATQLVSGGFGAVVGSSGQVTPPVRLLPAPEVAGLPVLQERLLMRFAVPPVPGAAGYRGEIASDPRFDIVLADLQSGTPELRFAELPDGDYVLRVRAIAANGLEGKDADHRFTLKARPEAPLPSSPQPRAVLHGDRVDFSWAANAEAHTYRLRLARGPDFKTPLRDISGLRELTATLEGLAPGAYQWQLASVRENGDRGPWDAPRTFDLKPLPPAPVAKPPTVGDRGVSFTWEGAPGQTFEFQLARDAAFTEIVLKRELAEPGIDLAPPGTGRFWMRLRARDADGFVGPYATPQFFDVPNCLRDGSGNCVRAGEQTLNLAP